MKSDSQTTQKTALNNSKNKLVLEGIVSVTGLFQFSKEELDRNNRACEAVPGVIESTSEHQKLQSNFEAYERIKTKRIKGSLIICALIAGILSLYRFILDFDPRLDTVILFLAVLLILITGLGIVQPIFYSIRLKKICDEALNHLTYQKQLHFMNYLISASRRKRWQ